MSETEKSAPPPHDVFDLTSAAELSGARAVIAPNSANSSAKPLSKVIEHKPPSRLAVWTRRLAIFAAIGGGIGFLYWQAHRAPAIPAWIVSGNGRLEADPIDIATKFAGRVLKLLADEGDAVKAGQIVAVMDTRDLEQSLKKAESQIELAKKAVEEAKANVTQMQSQSLLAEQEMVRAQKLLQSGYTTKQVFDQRKQQLDSAHAAQTAAGHRVVQAERALESAQHDAGLIRVNIEDNRLFAPRDGRIEYRIANIGEVLPVGGRVFTMLDTGYVYMDVYLPTLAADKVKIGSDARIVLDAYPDRPIPAKVSFLADQAQFTPKMVETRNDRDKLMFRVRVRIDPARSQAHSDSVRSGLPGVAYVKTDPEEAWTPALQGTAE
jgi:HlyD family secretion protein